MFFTNLILLKTKKNLRKKVDSVKMPNSVKDSVITEENPYSFRNLEIAEFFLTFPL